MHWSEFVAAAQEISWITYVATADDHGRPHVAAVAPGYSKGVVWFATRASSRKAKNLARNDEVAFHWPVGAGRGPGELAAWGRAIVHTGDDERRRIWDSGVMPYDLAGFWQSPENPDLVFVETAIRRARLLGPDFVPQVWTPDAN